MYIYIFYLEVLSPAAFAYSIHLVLATILQNITTLVSTEEGTKPKRGLSNLSMIVSLVNGKIRL